MKRHVLPALPRIVSRHSHRVCSLLAVLAFSALMNGCGRYFAPDRNVKEKLTESDVIGEWKMTTNSLSLLMRDGFQPEQSQTYTIAFHKDGSCVFESVNEFAQKATYVSAGGVWKLQHDVPRSDNAKVKNAVRFELKIEGVTHFRSLHFTREDGVLKLWEFYGDPDAWEFVEYVREKESAAATDSTHMSDRHDRQMTVSCANHAKQLDLLIRMFCEENEYFPSEKDARTAFVKMSGSDGSRSNWLYSIGSACPESFKRDGSFGYVFVADGLPVQTPNEHPSLVFFCPAESHQRSDQHCHAVLTDQLRCIESNVEMMEILRQELSRAKEGLVPYSTNAQILIERELAAREKRVK